MNKDTICLFAKISELKTDIHKVDSKVNCLDKNLQHHIDYHEIGAEPEPQKDELTKKQRIINVLQCKLTQLNFELDRRDAQLKTFQDQIERNYIEINKLKEKPPLIIYQQASDAVRKCAEVYNKKTAIKKARIEELESDNYSYKNRIQKCCDENLNLKSKIKELKRINKSNEKNQMIQGETIRNLREKNQLLKATTVDINARCERYLARINQLESEGCCIMSEKRKPNEMKLDRVRFNELLQTEKKYNTLVSAILKSKED